jgi:hypothetical protein
MPDREKRIATHPKRADRQERAKKFQERMAKHPQSVAQREASRGYPARQKRENKDLTESIDRMIES